jgi:hypothetical protein
MKRFHQKNSTLSIPVSPPILPHPDLKTPPEREYDGRFFRLRLKNQGHWEMGGKPGVSRVPNQM